MISNNKRYLLYFLAAILSVAMTIMLITTKMIPGKFLILLVVVLLAVLSVLFFVQLKWSKPRFILSAIVEVIMIAVSLYGIIFLVHTNMMLNTITKTIVESDSIVVYTMKDSPINALEDALDSNFGAVAGQTEEAIDQFLKRLKTDYGKKVSVKQYEDMFQAVDALYAGEIQVLVLNEAYAGLIAEVEGYELFDIETKIIANSLETVEVKVIVSEEPDEESESDESFTGESEESGEESSEESSEESVPESSKESTGSKESTVASESKGPDMQLMETPEQVDWDALVNQGSLTAPEGSFVVYLSGADTWGAASTKARSDVNILAVVNTNTHNMLLVSTPRDYYVPLPHAKGVKDKLTHAGIYGINSSVETLAALYGVNINYYMRMNFTGFVGIIDSLGGVDVYSDSTFRVDENFAYVTGVQHMSGIEALAFARERHAVAGGDVARGIHQMEVIKSVVNKCTDVSILYNYANVMNSVSGCFVTDMPKDTMASLVRMQLNDMRGWNISSVSASGTGAYKKTYSISNMNVYVMVPDDNSVQNIKNLIAATLGQ